MNTIQIPPVLRTLSSGAGSIEAKVATVREAIMELERRFPGMRDRLCEGDMLRPGLNVVVGSHVHCRMLNVPIPTGAEILFIPAVAGG